MNLRLLVLPLLLAACSPTPQTDPKPAAPATPATAPAAASSSIDNVDSKLAQYHWRLTDAVAADGQPIDSLLLRPEQPVQLDFISGRVAVSNTCNRLSGDYQVKADRLQITTMAQTQMACEESLMALDSAIHKRLSGDSRFSFESDGGAAILKLVTANGDTLSFLGEPTADTRFGSEGEQIFLEVSPELGPCQEPPKGDEACLQVRELHYDEAGVRRASESKWQPLREEIEGYTHEDGVRNVLRLNRYALKADTAGGIPYAYVLDMVVESETVPR